MISYEFSKREKILIGLLAFVLLFIAWFVFVYQNSTNEITRLEGEISSVNSTISYENTRLAQMTKMQKEIDERKAAGMQPKPVPQYDNLQPLMAELNGILGGTQTYTLSFDAIKTDDKSTYVNRGVSINFRCDSYDSARQVLNALANGTYPCVIDSLSVVDRGGMGGTNSILGLITYTSSETSNCTATIHVTFFERK